MTKQKRSLPRPQDLESGTRIYLLESNTSGRALDLLGAIHDQLAFQNIKMEVVVRESSKL